MFRTVEVPRKSAMVIVLSWIGLTVIAFPQAHSSARQ